MDITRPIEPPTARQRQVLDLIAEGHSQGSVARILGITRQAVSQIVAAGRRRESEIEGAAVGAATPSRASGGSREES